jgi:hypothetical protein
MDNIYQILYSVSEGIGSPLANSSEGTGNFCHKHIFARGLPTPSDPLAEGINCPPGQLAERYLVNL